MSIRRHINAAKAGEGNCAARRGRTPLLQQPYRHIAQKEKKNAARVGKAAEKNSAWAAKAWTRHQHRKKAGRRRKDKAAADRLTHGTNASSKRNSGRAAERGGDWAWHALGRVALSIHLSKRTLLCTSISAGILLSIYQSALRT